MLPGASVIVESAAVASSDPDITRADVAHVAQLARLALTDEEMDGLTEDLAAILGHASDIADLDIADVPPTSHPLPLRNVLRADERRPGVDRDEVLGEAPAAQDDRFRVPRILGDDQ